MLNTASTQTRALGGPRSGTTTVKLFLTGSNKGKTINLRVGAGDHVIRFVEGVASISGPVGDIAGICLYMERSYQAYPEGHSALVEENEDGPTKAEEAPEQESDASAESPVRKKRGRPPKKAADDGVGNDVSEGGD